VGVHDTVVGTEMRELFRRARDERDEQAAVLLDVRVYMQTMDLVVDHGWRYPPGKEGRELFRHVSRLALARYVDPVLWAGCRSCNAVEPLVACTACRGTGSLLISLQAFEAQLGGDEALLCSWQQRVDMVARKISQWVDMGAAA
jgi:hypothetical protein